MPIEKRAVNIVREKGGGDMPQDRKTQLTERREIINTIGFYGRKGWNWIAIVEYLTAKANRHLTCGHKKFYAKQSTGRPRRKL